MEVFSWIMGGPIGRSMARSFNGVWRIFMRRGFVNQPSDRELAMYEAPFRDKMNRIQTTIFPRQLVKAYEFEAKVESGLKTLAEKPVLFLWGNKDFAFKAPELERFKSHFPNHVQHSLEASHFWQDEQGKAATDHIIDLGTAEELAMTEWFRVSTRDATDGFRKADGLWNFRTD